MNKRVVRRLLETFLRRSGGELVPLVLFVGRGCHEERPLGQWLPVGGRDRRVATATLLSQLTSIRGRRRSATRRRPASTSWTMNSLLRTDNFLQEIADAAWASVPTNLKSGQITPRSPASRSTPRPMATRCSRSSPHHRGPAAVGQAWRRRPSTASWSSTWWPADVSESKAAETFFADPADRPTRRRWTNVHAALNVVTPPPTPGARWSSGPWPSRSRSSA